MKVEFRRIASLAAAIAFALTVFSCSDNHEGSQTATTDIVITQTMYKEERVMLPEGFSSVISSRYIEETGKICLIFNASDGSVRMTYLNQNLEDEESILLLNGDNLYGCVANIAADGSVTLATLHFEPSEKEITDFAEYYKTTAKTYEIRRYNAAGELTTTIDMNGIDQYFNPESSHYEAIIPYGDSWIISFFDGWAIVDENGEIGEVKADISDYYLGTDKNGKVIAATFDDYCYLDGSTLKISDERTAFAEGVRRSGTPMPGIGDFTAYFHMNEGLFGLASSGEMIKILDYSDSEILTSEIYDICYAAEGQFMLIGCNTNGYYMSKLEVRPDDYVENKETVVVAVEWGIYDDVRTLATMFNKYSDNYEVELKAYTDAVDDLKADILAGDGPDVYKYSDVGEMYNLTNMGALANMYDLMTEYGGFQKEDVLDNIIEAFEYKGGLYGISDKFYIDTYFANSEIIGKEYTNWSLEDFYSFAENMPENMYLGDQATFNTRENVLAFLMACKRTWIDYENATCNFNSDEFIRLLEFSRDAKTLPERDWQEFYDNTTQEEQDIDRKENFGMIKNKTALLVNTIPLHDLSDLTSASYNLGLSLDEITLLYPPSEDGQGTLGIFGGDLYSVIANGKCVEGGWEFVNYIMSFQYQSELYGIVTRKDAFEYMLNDAQAKSQKTVVMTADGQITYDYGYAFPLTDEMLDYFREYVGGCTRLNGGHMTISEIIREEYDYFINGEVTAEQCAEMIQNRVSLYLSENA